MTFKDVSIRKTGAVTVGLAILWSNHYDEPIYQEISNQAATNSAYWADHLEQEQRLWLVDRIETMCLYGEPLAILDRQGDWFKVAAKSQRTIKNILGYPGWILANQLSFDTTFLSEQDALPEAVIAVPKTTLFSDPNLTNPRDTLTFQTRLPILAEKEAYFAVRLPDGGQGYLARPDTKKALELFFSEQNIVATAKRFVQLKYLWGGTSIYGYDCSGFMFRLYQSNGIFIPRDAADQAQQGMEVSEKNLLPGDLLFFSPSTARSAIHHVAMYLGANQMIHSPNSKAAIRIEKFASGNYAAEFWGSRRYSKSR